MMHVIYILGVGVIWVQLLGFQGARARVIHVLHEAVSLLLPAFDDTGSLGYLFAGWSIPLVPPWVSTSCFHPGNRVAELRPTTFSSLLL